MLSVMSTHGEYEISGYPVNAFESVEKGNQDVDSSNDKDIETCVEKLGFRVC
jgi:hypothetical protein